MDIKKVRCYWMDMERNPQDPDGEPLHVHKSCTGEEAVALMRESALKYRMYVYTTDEQALEDFLAVYWATMEVVE